MHAHFFGPVKQLGYVVRNLDSALDFWTGTLGVGPFFKNSHIRFEHYEYEDRVSAPELSVALGYWGDMQIELIEQHNDAPSFYLDFLNENGPGLHHVMASSQQPLDEVLADLARQSRKPISRGGTSKGRFVYFDFGGPGGTAVELIEVGAEVESWFAHMRRATAEWDGSDPIRTI